MLSGSICAFPRMHRSNKLVRYLRNLVRNSLSLGWTLFGSRIGNGAFHATEFTGSPRSTQRVGHFSVQQRAVPLRPFSARNPTMIAEHLTAVVGARGIAGAANAREQRLCLLVGSRRRRGEGSGCRRVHVGAPGRPRRCPAAWKCTTFGINHQARKA